MPTAWCRLVILTCLVMPCPVGCARAGGDKPSVPTAPARTAPQAAESPVGAEPMRPLPVLQRQAYPEAITGRFISLVDFEAAPGPLGGRGPLAVQGVGPGRLTVTSTRTRTGIGALAVELPPGGRLVFRTAGRRDMSLFTLLSAAVHVAHARDDFVITLVGTDRRWRSWPRLLGPGWNVVMVDLARLHRLGALDLSDVRQVEMSFSTDEPGAFHLDDLLLIDNTRRIVPTPAGLVLRRSGLDYELTLPGWPNALRLAQGPDGLWRLGAPPAVVQLGTPSAALEGRAESIALMGPRRAGQVELLEANPVRVRLASTWYFPPEVGFWRHWDERRLRWEFTFHADGRYVTHLELSNAGGPDVAQVRLVLPGEAAWSDGAIGAVLHARDLPGQFDQWAWLTCPPTPEAPALLADYAHPPAMTIVLGRPGGPEAGDADGDGFDHAQGCYVARAIGGHCRLELDGGPRALRRPVFRILAPWTRGVVASRAGLALRPVAMTDGQAVAMLPEILTAPTTIEFAGPVRPWTTRKTRDAPYFPDKPEFANTGKGLRPSG